MRILVGLKVGSLNCVGHESEDVIFFECTDIHQAAVETLKQNWSNAWWVHYVIDGEFHDTQTQKTWTVDSRGHTKKDYRTETDNVFSARWEATK